ncbi:hypothetical protein [Lacisediminimonas sp.]|uniref:hypothetical protein n=1 Tax=Lacisediminimonas sp. TaxID=3060582 RepID=UPI00272D8258|nr:hypothetical protein [Lacisediminimonas sp.]
MRQSVFQWTRDFPRSLKYNPLVKFRLQKAAESEQARQTAAHDLAHQNGRQQHPSKSSI